MSISYYLVSYLNLEIKKPDEYIRLVVMKEIEISRFI